MNSFIPIILTIVLGVFYVSISSIGIDIYNKCNELKTSDKWKNLHSLLSHTLVIAMVIPGVLLMQYLASGNVMGGMGILYGLMGLVGSSVSYGIYNESVCKKFTTDSQKTYLIIAIVGSIITLIGSGILVSSTKSTTSIYD